MSLLDTIAEWFGHDDSRTRVPGFMIGVVSQIDATKAQVKVKFPVLSEDEESEWARIAVPLAGDKAGTYLLPEKGDEVLVGFEQSNINYPYVIGALWGKDKPPESKKEKRLIKSRSGHQILMDDTQGSLALTITTPGGQTIKLKDGPGQPAMTIDATNAGSISITCLSAEVKASTSATFTTPKATFSGIVTAQLIQTQVIQAQTVVGTAYTPAPGNTFGM
ncbi:MAG: phage baseplate assembly protein V [Bacillota bacterium]